MSLYNENPKISF